MFEYVSKFLIGGMILVLATYFSKSKNLFLAGLITTMPLLTLANLSVQLKYLNIGEFKQTQKNGIFGALGLALFILCCYVLCNWMKGVEKEGGDSFFFMFATPSSYDRTTILYVPTKKWARK